MPLAPGTDLGAYKIIAPLGAGGMGEVYRARDTRLGREVALKVMPLSRQDDAERRSRFAREAQALAALNNPHIAAVYDVVDVGDQRAIVMELVMGPTLAAVIARGPVPMRLALGYAIDISEALSAAHAAGIVHRDLKPANVVITETGSAKVLDFGVAKLGAVDDGTAENRGTMTAVTQSHAVIGTVGYMSPEQAHGRQLDGRSDIFCLGIVLYEMISGQSAFYGDSAASLLSAVLRDDPPLLRTVVSTTPRSVERCVARCLEKDPRRRYQTATDLAAALADLREDLGSPVATAAGDTGTTVLTPATVRVRARSRAYAVAATLAAGALGFGLSGVLRSPAILSPSLRPFITEGASVGVPVWSPDGRTLAYMAGNGPFQVFLRGIDATESTQVARGADGISMFWAPDGSRIYFTRGSDGALVSVSAGGGEPQVVITAAPNGADRSAPSRLAKVCMSPDGRTIVFGRAEPGSVRLWTLDTRTGDMHQLTVAGMAQPLANVQALAFSPDGKSLAAIASQTAMNDARGVWLMSWPGGSARQAFSDAPYLASNPSIGWLPDSRRFVMNGYPLHGGASRLLLAEIGSGLLTELTAGKDEEISPNVVADGSRIAFVSRRSGLDLIQFPVDGGPPEPILATSRAESFPDVSPSGAMAYVTDATGNLEVRIRSSKDAWPRTIGGSGGPERDRANEVRLSPDGARLAVNTYAAEHLIWIYPTAGGTRVRLDAETTDQHGPSWSPDGNWIAYRRLRNGQWEVVKAPVGGGAVMRLDEASPGGGSTDWSANDEWIAHSRPDGMHLVSPDGARTRVLAGIRSGWFRFSRDGSRLFVVRRAADRRWELTIWDLKTARQLRVVALPLAASAEIQGMALAPDESHIIVGTGTATSDIWLLERFEPSAPSWLSPLTRR